MVICKSLAHNSLHACPGDVEWILNLTPTLMVFVAMRRISCRQTRVCVRIVYALLHFAMLLLHFVMPLACLRHASCMSTPPRQVSCIMLLVSFLERHLSRSSVHICKLRCDYSQPLFPLLVFVLRNMCVCCVQMCVMYVLRNMCNIPQHIHACCKCVSRMCCAICVILRSTYTRVAQVLHYH